MPGSHSQFSPSAAHRWMACPGSVAASAEIEERVSSFAAAEGTVAHAVREECLRFGFEPEDFVGEVHDQEGHRIVVDDEMADALRPGIERIRERPGEKFYETRVLLDEWLPGQFGTLDVGIASATLIEIDDLKYGTGPVHPERNPQAMIYALGFWHQIARHVTDAREVRITIDQPRAVRGGGGEWATTLDELLAFGEEVRAAYRAAQEPDAPRVPGEKQCRWCAAKATCPALAAHNLQALGFEDLDAPERPSMEEFGPERRALVAANEGLITDWLKAVKARVLADALTGKPTPGLKAVQGRAGHRRWTDTGAAAEFLLSHLDEGRVFGERPLASPAQAEKALPKDVRALLDDLTTRPEARPVLVPAADRRKAITGAAMFASLDDD